MACESCKEVLSNIWRKKIIGIDGDPYETTMQRTLTTFHLVLMGIGSMIGAGIFVLTGVVARETTGPAIILSYGLAALASFLSASCFVEFACSVSKTGSAYTFTYITIGEIWAFIIGWNMILEYSILVASVASSFVGYTDSMCEKALSNFTIKYVMGGKVWNVPYIAPYPNIFAALLVILITIPIIIGTKTSSFVNGTFVAIKSFIVAFIIILGFQKGDIRNWQENGGFIPNGAESVIAGAATLFFSFVGFDIIAMANEETVDPKKSIPRATFISLFIVTIIYVLCSAVLTLMLPYTDIDESSAFESAFAVHGLQWAQWIVGVGALCAMISAIMMALYALSRTLYAIASDGLLFTYLASVNQITKTPIVASFSSMVLTAILATFFSSSQLVQFLSIGSLSSYAFVALSVIILRYKPDDMTISNHESIEINSLHEAPQESPNGQGQTSNDEDASLDTTVNSAGTLRRQFRTFPVLKWMNTIGPGKTVKACLGISVTFQFLILLMVNYEGDKILGAAWWAILLLIIFILGAFIALLVIFFHNQNEASRDYYRVPLMPWIPALNIFCNVMLMLMLDEVTWLRFVVWLFIGLVIYIFYGYKHSEERLRAGLSERERLIIG